MLLGTGKELEIAKQLFDTATLADYVTDYDLFPRTYNTGYNTDDATWKACKVMYLASCLLSGNPLKKIEEPESYLSERLEGDQYKNHIIPSSSTLSSLGFSLTCTLYFFFFMTGILLCRDCMTYAERSKMCELKQ